MTVELGASCLRATYTLPYFQGHWATGAFLHMGERAMAETTPDSHRSGTLTRVSIMDMLREHQRDLQALGVQSLGLFGSYRRGTPHAASDLDFLLVLQRPSFADYMAVKFFLEDLFGRSVDLVLAESLKPRLREHILAEVLYAEGLSPVS